MSDPLKVGSPLPQSIGLCADFYHDVRELRLLMEKELKALADREREIKDHIINNLALPVPGANADTGASGMRYRAQIVGKEVPKVMDGEQGWPVLWAHIQRTGRFDFLQKRLSDKAIKDTLEAGEAVPGVETMIVKDVSITKI